MESNFGQRRAIDKPEVLYHASRTADIELFEPRAEHTRDEAEGPRVFATPSRALASVFLVETDDSWTQSGIVDGIPYIIISDEPRFRFIDRGGAIYSLPTDTFECDPDKGLREFEWTSSSPVKPNGVEVIPSALEDMLLCGVKVYFVDRNTFAALENAPDHGREIMDGLTQYSEK